MLWDLETGDNFTKYNDHQKEVLCMDKAEGDGNIIASGSGDKSIRIWDIREREPVLRIFEDLQNTVTAVRFFPNR